MLELGHLKLYAFHQPHVHPPQSTFSLQLTMDEVVPLLGTLQFHFSPENTQYLLQLSPNGEVSFKQFIMWYKGLN